MTPWARVESPKLAIKKLDWIDLAGFRFQSQNVEITTVFVFKYYRAINVYIFSILRYPERLCIFRKPQLYITEKKKVQKYNFY